MFSLVVRLQLNVCHHCGNQIDDVADLSIEHKKPWQKADDPIAAFFDLENIGFSHVLCNIGYSSRPNQKYKNAQERKRASDRRNYPQRIAKRDEWRRNKQSMGLPYT